MTIVFRLLVMLFVVPAMYFFMFWVPGSFLPESSWMQSALALLGAGGAGWYVWTRLGLSHPGMISSTLVGAAVLGGISFCAGFFGPMIFSPGSNQGPMLGIFITGPLGFLLGAVGGAVYWRCKLRDPAQN